MPWGMDGFSLLPAPTGLRADRSFPGININIVERGETVKPPPPPDLFSYKWTIAGIRIVPSKIICFFKQGL